MRAAMWPVRYEVQVTWRDLDGAGHANNAVYVTWMESARVEAYFRLKGGERVADLDIILARTTIDYRSPALFRETIVVEVTPGAVGNSSFGLKYEMREKKTGRLVAEGESVQVMFDYAKHEKKPLPPEMRARLADGKR